MKKKAGFFVNKLSVKKSNVAKAFTSQDEKLLASEGVLETTRVAFVNNEETPPENSVIIIKVLSARSRLRDVFC